MSTNQLPLEETMTKFCIAAVFVLAIGVGVSRAQADDMTPSKNAVHSTSATSNDATNATSPAATDTDGSSLQCEAPVPEPADSTCYMCGSGSTGSCAKQSGKARVQCKGSRKSCRNKGCHISGTASCSGAGNVQTC